MTNAKRGSGSHRWVYLCAAAALGIALSGCGGGSGAGGAAATSQASSQGSSAPTGSATNGAAVTLNWTAPTENTDGTQLDDLAGYDIHYGTASGTYTQTITVSNPDVATYVVDNLSPGTYYFAVTAVNSDGTQSPLSSEVETTVD